MRSQGLLIFKSYKTASMLGIVALVLMSLPENQVNSIRSLVHDSLVPGSEILSGIVSGSQSETKKTEQVEDHESEKKVAELEKELEALKTRSLLLKSQNIDLQKQILAFHKNGKPEFQGEESEPLIVPELLEARVLGKEYTQKSYAKQILKIGSRDGISKESLVLQSNELLIDQGNELGISVEQLVFTGRILIGRISQTGFHTSTLQPVTDPEFRAKVHIYPADSEKMEMAGEGILTGSEKDYCYLRFVPTTQPVSVGDEIYTGDTGEVLPSPIYIGKVIEASHRPDEQFWTIKVQPAYKNHQPETVQVLRIIPNPKRLAARMEP